MILLIDNYDSFVYNLARYFVRLGQTTHVVRNDQITIGELATLKPEAIVLSPGPGGPKDAGVCLDVVRRFSRTVPMLGVCLGHQVVAEAFGGKIIRSRTPMHGRSSLMDHGKSGLFESIPVPTTVARYHSLVVDAQRLPTKLQVTARTDDGTIMSVQHADFPVFGVQFHPESILTSHGYEILQNFLRIANVAGPTEAPDFEPELIHRPTRTDVWPERPVTF